MEYFYALLATFPILLPYSKGRFHHKASFLSCCQFRKAYISSGMRVIKKIKKIKKAFSVFPYHKFSRRKICSPTYISNTTYRGLGPQEWWFLSKTFSHTEKAVPRWKTDRGDLHALTLVTVQMLCLEGLQPLPPLSQPPTYTYRGGHLTQAQRRPFSRKEKHGKTLQ